MELALRPSTPAPREQRQPKRKQRAEATDSEAHGIPAGPVFRSGVAYAAPMARALASENIEAVGLRGRASSEGDYEGPRETTRRNSFVLSPESE